MSLNPEPSAIEARLISLCIDDSKEAPHGPATVAAPPTPPFSPDLLRLKIWSLSFLARTVELHSRRAHYASTDFHPTTTPVWHSKSRNPAALSVSAEARSAALSHYRVALPLDAVPSRHEHVALTGLTTCERPGDTVRGGGRVLYVDPARDTVVLCAEVVFRRVKGLLDWFRGQDRTGRGLRRLAMSVKAWAASGPASAMALKAFGATVFGDVDEFYLFFYDDWVPPEAWTGARCELVRLAPEEDVCRRFLMGRGSQFRDGDRWIVVGKRPMEVVEIRFHDEGW